MANVGSQDERFELYRQRAQERIDVEWQQGNEIVLNERDPITPADVDECEPDEKGEIEGAWVHARIWVPFDYIADDIEEEDEEEDEEDTDPRLQAVDMREQDENAAASERLDNIRREQ